MISSAFMEKPFYFSLYDFHCILWIYPFLVQLNAHLSNYRLTSLGSMFCSILIPVALLKISSEMHLYIYIYIYVCVCTILLSLFILHFCFVSSLESYRVLPSFACMNLNFCYHEIFPLPDCISKRITWAGILSFLPFP